EPDSTLGVAERGRGTRLVDPEMCDLERRSCSRDDRIGLLQRTRRFLGAAEVEADVRERLLRMSERIRVTRHAERLERLPRVGLGERALPLLEQQARLGPVETRAGVRVRDLAPLCERVGNDLLGLC